jgi:hypothetical protein
MGAGLLVAVLGACVRLTCRRLNSPRPRHRPARCALENIVAAVDDWEPEDGPPGDATGPAAQQFFLVDFGGAARLPGPGVAAGRGAGRPEQGAAGGPQEAAAPPLPRQAWITPCYASVAALRGRAPDPGDDAEALLAVLLWLATGQLPWWAGMWGGSSFGVERCHTAA